VVEMEGGRVRRFVEKPEVPPSNLAIVGAYYFHDAPALWAALDRVVEEDIRTRGEYQLTDALQLMVEAGADFTTMPVTDWYDCGKKETWLATNRVLLERAGGAGRPDVAAPCHVADDVVIEESRIGPNVSIGAGCVLRDCVLSDCVVGDESRLEGCRLTASLVGDHCDLRGVVGELNVGDYCEIAGTD
jgi:glucose-1-phosphate thymidylyltransferase